MWGAKKEKNIVNFVDHREIRDEDGYADFAENLVSLMQSVIVRENFQNELFTVLVSKVWWKDKKPFRYEQKRTLWFQKLKEYREERFEEDLSVESLENQIELLERKHEALYKEGQRRAGWGAFVNYMSIQKAINEEHNFKESLRGLSDKEVDEARKKRNKEISERPQMLVIT